MCCVPHVLLGMSSRVWMRYTAGLLAERLAFRDANVLAIDVSRRPSVQSATWESYPAAACRKCLPSSRYCYNGHHEGLTAEPLICLVCAGGHAPHVVNKQRRNPQLPGQFSGTLGGIYGFAICGWRVLYLCIVHCEPRDLRDNQIRTGE